MRFQRALRAHAGGLRAVWGGFLILVLVVGDTRPAHAFGPWSDPVEVSQSPNDSQPDVAVNAAGDVVFVWHDAPAGSSLDRVYSRRYSPTGGMGTTRVISPAGRDSEDARVALDDEGDATFVWTDKEANRVRARVWFSNDTLGPTRKLSHSVPIATGETPKVVVDSDGDAIFAWIGEGSRLVARPLSSTGVRGPLRFVSWSSESVESFDLDLNPSGRGGIGWVAEQKAKGRGFDSNGTFGPRNPLSKAENLTSTTPASGPVAAAVDDHGVATIAWQHRVDEDSWHGTKREILPNGQMSGSTGAYAFSNQPINYVDVATQSFTDTPFKATVFAYQEGQTTIRSRRFFREGVAFDTVAVESTGAGAVSVAIDEERNITYVWVGYDGSDYFVRTRTRSVDGSFGPVHTLGQTRGARSPQSASDHPWFYQPVLATGSEDHAALVWADGSGRKEAALSSP